MRFLLSILLFTAFQPALADAYKCKSPTGQVVFTDKPCELGYSQHSSSKSDPSDYESIRRAQSDLQRQKNFVASRDAERSSYVPAAPGIVSVDSNNRDAIYACLMKVTATPRLDSVSQASRKVSCYSGTVGLIDECQSSVTATTGLSTAQENNIKRGCR